MYRLALTIAVLLAACQPTPPPEPAPLPPAEPEAGATAAAEAEPETGAAVDTEADAAAAAVPLKITFVDVDEGDAILIQAGDFDALIDTGSNGKWDGQLEDALESVTGPLELLFLTHPHEDHYGQADEVLEMLEVLEVVTNGEGRGPPRDTKTLRFYEEFRAALDAEGLAERVAGVEEVFSPVPGLNILVLASGGRFPDTSSGSNINNGGGLHTRELCARLFDSPRSWRMSSMQDVPDR